MQATVVWGVPSQPLAHPPSPLAQTQEKLGMTSCPQRPCQVDLLLWGKTRPGFSSKATHSASFLTSLPRLEWWLCLSTLNLGAIHHLVLRPTEFLWMTHEAPSASAPAIICEATRGTKLTVPFSFHVERGRASPQGPLGGTCRFGCLTLQGLVKKDTANSHSQPMCPLMLEAQVSLPGRPSLAGPQGHTSGTPEARVLLCASCVHI